MTSRSLSLTALSCVLATAGTGCSRSLSDTSDSLKALLDDGNWNLGKDAEAIPSIALDSQVERQTSQTTVAQTIAHRRPEALPPQLSDPQRFVSPQQTAEPKSSSHPALSRPFSPQHSMAEQNARSQRHWTAGVDAGYAASISEQSAVTDADWNQVVSQWKSAIAHLSRIRSDHAQYNNAQSKLAIYRQGLSRAEGQYIAVVQARYQAMSHNSWDANPSVSQSTGAIASNNLPTASQPSMLSSAPRPVADSRAQQESFEADGDRLRRWIETGDFSAAEQLLNQAIQKQHHTRNGLDYADAVLVSAVSRNKVVFTPATLARLNQWVSQSPRSSMAYAARSYFTQAYLWEDMALEIGQRPKKCPPTDADLERMGISAADASMALSLDPDNPLALTSKLRLGKLGVISEQEFEATFRSLTRVAPHSFQAHLEKANYLWTQDKSGSGEAALAFLRQASTKAPKGSALPMLVPMMHINVANSRLDYRQYLNQPSTWQEIQTKSEQVVAQLPEAAPYSQLFADLASTTGRGALARRYQQISMNRTVSHPNGQAWPKMMTSM